MFRVGELNNILKVYSNNHFFHNSISVGLSFVFVERKLNSTNAMLNALRRRLHAGS